MLKRFSLIFAVVTSLSIAGSVPKPGVYAVTLAKPAAISGTVLKPGDYKLVLGDTKVTITPKKGGQALEAPVKLDKAAINFGVTTITYQQKNGGSVISEIDLGGSKTKVMFVQ